PKKTVQVVEFEILGNTRGKLISTSQTPCQVAAAETIETMSRVASGREYYGFVVYLSSGVLFAIYLVWAFVPNDILHEFGFTYYPNKNWALILPIWMLGLIPFILLMFTGINLLRTPPFDHITTIT
ncbi:hypothetical protein HK102_008463, partial [Quaeritorhiza haematococci]